MFEDRKIFILGLARSGYEAGKLLAKYNNQILIYDDNRDQDIGHVAELKALGINVVFEGQPDDLLDENYDYLVKNPGVPIDHKYVKMAEKYNIPIINEVELAYHLFPKGITLIGITGTNGKTTVTTLIYEMLKRDNLSVHLTGNIGFPLCGFIEKLKPNDIVVMEVSVQQLINTKDFKTNISVMTNLSEAHIDFVKNYENYIQIKNKIFNHHTKDDIAILNAGDPLVMESSKNIKSTKKYFSSKEKVQGSYLFDNVIYYNDEKVIDIDDIRIAGTHNYENIMAAIMVAKEFNVDNQVIKDLLKDFAGVEHRLEFVDKINDVEIYNDSKATNIKSTQIALGSFRKPIILILGGMERKQDFFELTNYVTLVKHIVCYGETKDRIKEFADKLNIDCIVLDHLEDVVRTSYQLSNPGDIILFSPACASWDQYKDFEERGSEFKKFVGEIQRS